MKAQVFLKKNPDFGSQHGEQVDSASYELATSVTTRKSFAEKEMLERVFALTNEPEMFEHLWSGESPVFTIKKFIPRHRSTSVGDVVLLQDEAGRGHFTVNLKVGRRCNGNEPARGIRPES
jgi:hypothetical protein